MNPFNFLCRIAAVLWLQAVMSVAVAQSGAAAKPLTLHHPFVIGAAGDWVEVTVPLRHAGWRVRGSDGPPATADQFKAVMDGLEAIVIGGRCTGGSDGATYYPCTFALELPRIEGPGTMPPQRIDPGWLSTTADTLTRFDVGVVHAMSISPHSVSSTAVHAMTTSFSVTSDFLGLIAPPQLRARATPAAPGHVLRFRFRAEVNKVQASHIDARSGVVILGTQSMLPRHVRPGRLVPI